MNTKKVVFGLLTFSLFLFAACTDSSVSEDSVYDQGVDRTKIINGDKKNVDRTKVINGDKRSVDRTKVINGDKKRN